ncbi:INO80 complex subunit 4 [Lecanosticta acicola]|uniref:INO80 complex subunit 4 n=1 Tax=Lecanosticta acicola TaxID=111012 RepID=A0AAI8YR86_9PEZI|nr:INO80 complex subunit 4 [Lecanosticta acicola]
MSTTITTTKAVPKSAKKSRIVVLRVSHELLSQWPSDTTAEASVKRNSINDEASPSIQLPDTADKSSDSNATPVPAPANDAATTDSNSLAPPKIDGRKKRGGAATGGRKRAPPSIDPNAPPRERGRPGPKKKPRLADGTIDRSGEKGPTGTNPIPAHKLGPKANTGAINAGLRALDRTGKPCRKWAKKGLQLKSFTGAIWSMPSWKAPPRDQGFAGDVKSDSTGSSEVKPVNESSAVASERSHSHLGGETATGGDTTMMNGIESSPAPPIAA